MAKSIEPKLKAIKEYLELKGDTVFTIPEYQRPYSWSITNCDKLWQDITDFIDSKVKDPYFFGTIIINCQDNDRLFDLIDGQQRTTTFLLLLKALLIRVNIAIGDTEHDEDSESLCRGLKERRRKIMGILYKAETEDIPDRPNIEKDRAICGNAPIIQNNSINEQYQEELQTILSSVDYAEAESRVIKFPRKKKDNRYTNFFRNFKFFYEKASELSVPQLNSFAKSFLDSCEVIEIRSWQVEQAITMFNSLNSDGLPLRDADIISAKLYAVAAKSKLGDEFKRLWTELIDLIDELKQTDIADIDSILMQQMYFERAQNKNSEIITASGSINVTMPGLRRYYTEENKALLNDPIGLCSQMIKLAKIWKAVAAYPIIQVLLKFNDNFKLFIASYFHRFDAESITEADVNAIAKCLLKLFAVLELVDIGFSSKAFKTFLFGEIVKMANAKVSIAEIEADFSKHISANWKPDTIRDWVMEYDKNILVYLNEYLFALETGRSFSLGTKYDIEHIMPMSGITLTTIRRDAQIESDEEFRTVVNLLGNKILLEEKINRSIGNEWFRTKVSTKLATRSGYIDSDFPLASAFVERYRNDSKPFWCKQDIYAATEKASDRIVAFIFG